MRVGYLGDSSTTGKHHVARHHIRLALCARQSLGRDFGFRGQGSAVERFGFPRNGTRAGVDERLGVAIGWHGDVAGRNLPGHSTTNLPLDALEGWSVAFSSDGERLAVSSSLGYARIWQTATWREEATLRGFLKAVNSAVFSPDGQRLATGGSSPDDTVKLWDADSWQELLTLEGTGSEFGSTAFSPDGNAIGTLSSDGILRVWQAPSWAEIDAAEAKEKAETK